MYEKAAMVRVFHGNFFYHQGVFNIFLVLASRFVRSVPFPSDLDVFLFTSVNDFYFAHYSCSLFSLTRE